MNTKDKSVRL